MPTFEETGEDECPADEQEDAQVPLDSSEVLDPRRQLKDVASEGKSQDATV